MHKLLYASKLEGWLEYLSYEVPLLFYFSIITAFPGFEIPKFVAGILAMILIPGYLLGRMMYLWVSDVSSLGFSLILGLFVQMLNAYVIYVVDAFVRFNYVDFSLYVLLATAIETAFLIHFARPGIVIHAKVIDSLRAPKSKLMSASGIFLVSLAGSLFFQSFNQSAILPDGALYLDAARFIVVNGRFSSLVINDSSLNPFQNQVGLMPHEGTALLYALFFSIGNVSYQVAKWGTALIGALLVYPVFEIARHSFGKRAALISAAFIAALPLFRFYSTILYGPEILSALLAIFSLLLMDKAISHNRLRCSIPVGMLLFLSYFVWGGDIVPLVGAFVLLLTFRSYTEGVSPIGVLEQFLATVLLFSTFLIALVVSPNFQLWLAALSVISALLLTYRFLRIRNLKQLSVISLTSLAMMQLYLVRFYFFPGAGPLGASRPFITGDAYLTASLFLDYVWPSLYAASLPIILIPAFLSIIWVTRRALVPYSFLLAWLFTRLTLLPFEGALFVLTDERFYLTVTAFLVVFAGGFFSRLVSLVSQILRFPLGAKLIGLSRNLSLSGADTTILVAFVAAFILGSSFPLYSNYLYSFRTNSVEENGWTPVLDWIRDNTTHSDILLTTGSPRLWAWFTGRMVAGSYVVSNNSLLPLDQIGSTEFVRLLVEFSPKFVIVDSTLHGALFFLPKLSYLYGLYGPGTIFSLNSTSGTRILETVISSTSAVNNGTVTLYRVLG